MGRDIHVPVEPCAENPRNEETLRPTQETPRPTETPKRPVSQRRAQSRASYVHVGSHRFGACEW